MKKLALAITLVSLGLTFAVAQDQGDGPGRMPGEGVIGKVTAIGKDSVTIAPAKGGDPVIVKVDDDTRVSKERQPIKLSDIKVGDTVMARGEMSGGTLQARRLGVVDPEMLQRMQQGGPGMGFGGRPGGAPGGGQFNPEDWGKTFVAGQVKSINETTLTISRPNNEQTLNIEVDENTSFKKGRESVTLADIKTGDFVFGEGAVKNGVFVPKELRVGGGRRFMGQPNPGADQSTQGGDKPPTAPPKN